MYCSRCWGRLGLRFWRLGGGEEALALVTQQPPDVILMDRFMPDMDGLELMHGIQNRFSGNKIPIVIISAGVFADERSQALAAGADAFLSKPCQRHELLACLQVLLNVEYQYMAEPMEQATVPEETDVEKFTPVSFSVFTPELVDELRESVAKGHATEITRILEQMSQQDEKNTAKLRVLAASFDYETLGQWLKKA